MSKKKVLLRGVFINRDTNGEGVLKVGTTLIRVSTVVGILYICLIMQYNGSQTVLDIRDDLGTTMNECREVTEKYRTGRSAYLRLGQLFMRLFAGLL